MVKITDAVLRVENKQSGCSFSNDSTTIFLCVAICVVLITACNWCNSFGASNEFIGCSGIHFIRHKGVIRKLSTIHTEYVVKVFALCYSQITYTYTRNGSDLTNVVDLSNFSHFFLSFPFVNVKCTCMNKKTHTEV